MRLISIAIQNACEYSCLLVSGAHRGDDHASAPETCASTRLLWRFESHGRNQSHDPGCGNSCTEVSETAKTCTDEQNKAQRLMSTFKEKTSANKADMRPYGLDEVPHHTEVRRFV